jgi:hypothetical protein
MATTSLVEQSIRDGKTLIEALDRSGFGVHSALWYYVPETGRWLLIISSPIVSEKGPKEAYTSIQKVLAGLPHVAISLKDISVVSPDHELIRLFGPVISTGAGIVGVRFSQSTINGIFIEDAYIYRMQR